MAALAASLKDTLEGKSVAVLGLGVSGRSAARYCADQGAAVTAFDERSSAQIDAEFDAHGELETHTGIEVAVGAPFPDLAKFDLVVPSPGVPQERYASHSGPVWGDVELAYRALAIPIVAVTGTNGKSTTALLLEAMLREAGFRARAAGNLGPPALDLVGEPLDIAVLEVSSFQLETTDAFRPRVAVVLNATPDHLDRHGSFEAYVAAKARITAQQQESDTLVLNFDDPVVKRMADATRANVLPFSSTGALDTFSGIEGIEELERCAFIDTGSWVLVGRDREILRVALDHSKLEGAHNLENVTAALAAVTALGGDPMRAARALCSFRGLPHRSERVAEVRGVTFVNDSKATNPSAAERSLSSYAQPVVWIAGGRDKGLDFHELAKTANLRVRTAIVVGEAAEKLKGSLAEHVEVVAAASIDDAVRVASRKARAGDVVLLAPACASQDQFRDYAERGDVFRASVERLKAEEIIR